MSAREIGRTDTPKGKRYQVLWNEATKEVYVKRLFGSTTRCPTLASTAREAMQVGEAFLRDK